jgi:hypothetical protein
MQFELVKNLVIPGIITDPVAGRVRRFKRSLEECNLLLSRQELHLGRQFHMRIIEQISIKRKEQSPFLCPLKQAVSWRYCL